jgi:hypothetical protein
LHPFGFIQGADALHPFGFIQGADALHPFGFIQGAQNMSTETASGCFGFQFCKSFI